MNLLLQENTLMEKCVKIWKMNILKKTPTIIYTEQETYKFFLI